MKNKIKSFLLLTLILLLSIVTTSCDGKTPEDGYVTDQYILENCIKNLDECYASLTKAVNQAPAVSIVPVDNGYNLLLSQKYLGVYSYFDRVYVKYFTTPEQAAKYDSSIVWTWDDSVETFVILLNDSKYVLDLSSHNENEVFKVQLVSKATNQVRLIDEKENIIAHYIHNEDDTKKHYLGVKKAENDKVYLDGKLYCTTEITTYSYTATLNYLAIEEDLLPKEISKSKLAFIDSPNNYSKSCSSYFLRVPLHITIDNWILYDDKGNYDTTNSTKYILESKIYQPNGGYLDTIYYYPRENGGFYLKAFGVNKSLKIDRPTVIEPNAKWNIIIEYDENGYLVSETFQTLNAFKDPDSKTIYGKTVYKYE